MIISNKHLKQALHLCRQLQVTDWRTMIAIVEAFAILDNLQPGEYLP